MTVLALELSTSRRSVALFRPGSAPWIATESQETSPRATHAFALIEKALQMAGAEREEVQRLAIGLGPGSYTGIRVAISIAQGWSATGKISLVGIPTVEILAEQLRRSGQRGSVKLAFDAQRGDVYAAEYEIAEEIITPITPLHLILGHEIGKWVEKPGTTVLGPDLTSVLPSAISLLPDAGVLAEMASRLGPSETVSPEALAPIYLRDTQFVKLPGR